MDAQKTNPNFDQTSIPWSFNCQRCVPAYELRRRGYEVTARPCPTETSPTGGLLPKHDDHLLGHPFDVWVPPDSQYCPGGKQEVADQMAAWGDGARAEVMVLWTGQHGAGHVFVAEQCGGKTLFLDPQSGEEAVDWYFEECDQVYICRTDDKGLSGYIGECCQ